MQGPSYTGRVLGGTYQVAEKLGEGGWGAVYAGTEMHLGRKVALKILHVDVALGQDGVVRFEREARAAAALGHPNIVQVTDFRANPGEPPFLVMEHLTGATLGTVLKKQVFLPSGRVATIAFQMLAALDVAHRAGIVHRDVKPDNVFLVSMPGIEDFVKLLDFGIAKLSPDNPAQAAATPGIQLTASGQMLGSPAFMAPEQVRAHGVDPRTDIYAVGATMYFAMSGRLPADANNMASLLHAILEQPAKPLAEVAPGVDPRLAQIVERALEKDPARRFQSARDMRAALEPWMTSGALHLPSTLESAPDRQGVAAQPKGPAPIVLPIVNAPSGGVTPSPYAWTPPPPQGAHGPVHAIPPATTPSPFAPTPKSSSGLIIVLAIIGVLLFLILVGGGVGFYLLRSDAATTAAAPSISASPAAAPPTSAAATVVTTTTTPAPKPKPAPAPAPAPVPTPVVKKQFAGSTVRYSGGSLAPYDHATVTEVVNRVLPALNACFAATEFDPPDHQFTSWTITVSPAGQPLGVRRATNVDPHPKLDACMVAAFMQTKWPPNKGGTPQISLTSRTRDNP